MWSFASSAYGFFQKQQPIQWTGCISHTTRWLTADLRATAFPNPHFKPKETPRIESKEEKTPMPVPITVYCVHGTCDRSSAFHRLADRIYQELPPEVSSIKLASFEKRGRGLGIEEFARQLAEQIIANNETHVFLIGHSRGGLVIEAVLTLLEKAKITVHGIVTIGTPYRGSWLAVKPVTWVSGSVDEMKIESPFLKKIGEKVVQCTIPRFYYAAENDHIVSPKDSCLEEQVKSLTVLDRHGHLSILSSGRLAQGILENIKTTVDQLKTKTVNVLVTAPIVKINEALPKSTDDISEDWEIIKPETEHKPAEPAPRSSL